MSFTHALATNRYGEGDLIVSTNPANGTHTTLASALAAATSGQTIFLRDSVTENVNLVAGVNIVSWNGRQSNTPSITGKLSFSSSGTVNIYGITLITNSDNFLAVTGSSASIVNLTNCYLNCTNATGITFSSSSGSSRIDCNYCSGDIGTTGITLFSNSSSGFMTFNWCKVVTSGGTVTASTMSGSGQTSIVSTDFDFPLSTSNTAILQFRRSNIIMPGNTTALTHNSTAANCRATQTQFASNTATCISIGSGATFDMAYCDLFSSNTNVVSGLGTIAFTSLSFRGSSSGVNPSTISPLDVRHGYARSKTQPAFLSTLGSTDSNVTGAGTSYTLGSGNALTERFDQNGDMTTGGTFTAPMTGIYLLQFTITFSGLTSAMTNETAIINTSNDDYAVALLSAGAAMSNGSTLCVSGSVVCDMDAADTAVFQVTISNGAGDTADVSPKTSGVERTYVSGFMLC